MVIRTLAKSYRNRPFVERLAKTDIGAIAAKTRMPSRQFCNRLIGFLTYVRF